MYLQRKYFMSWEGRIEWPKLNLQNLDLNDTCNLMQINLFYKATSQ